MINNAVQTVIQENQILGKKIQMYGDIETLLFQAINVAGWIKYLVIYPIKKWPEYIRRLFSKDGYYNMEVA